MPRQSNIIRMPFRPNIRPDSTWQLGVARLSAWIKERNLPPVRPAAAIIVGQASGLVLGSDIASAFAAPDILDLVRQTASKPVIGQPHQPARIVCADATLAAELVPLLAPLGIACEHGRTPGFDASFASLDLRMRGGKALPPGFGDATGVTPERLAPIFAAAADFYRQAPWKAFDHELPIEIRLPADGGATFYVIVMGGLGEHYGLAFFRSFRALETALSDLPPEIVSMSVDNEAIGFGDVTTGAFSDLDAIARFGFEVAGDLAYPSPVKVSRRGQIQRPTLADLDIYEAALRVVPIFVREHLPAMLTGSMPVDVIIGTTVAGRPVEVRLRCPPIAEPPAPRTSSQPKRPTRPKRRG